MSTIVVGMIATADGASCHRSAELSQTGRGYSETIDRYLAPAVEYRSVQPSTIVVDVNHSERTVGCVRYLSLLGRGLYGVLEIDDDTADSLPEKFHLSGEIEGRRRDNVYTDIQLDAVALVERTAVIAQDPAAVCVGTLADAYCYHCNPNRSLLREAAAYHEARRYRGSQPHVIAGARTIEPRASTLPPAPEQRAYVRPRTGRMVRLPDGSLGELEYSAPVFGSVLSVR